MFYKGIATAIAFSISASVLAQNWTGLGEQLAILDDGWSVVSSIYNDGDSALYLGGKFTNSEDGVVLSKITKWDGQALYPVGCGFNFDCIDEDDLTTISGGVATMVRYQDTLYAAGSFTLSGQESLQNVAKWDGQNWVSVGDGFDMSVIRLEVIENVLYACGVFTASGDSLLNGIALMHTIYNRSEGGALKPEE